MYIQHPRRTPNDQTNHKHSKMIWFKAGARCLTQHTFQIHSHGRNKMETHLHLDIRSFRSLSVFIGGLIPRHGQKQAKTYDTSYLFLYLTISRKIVCLGGLGGVGGLDSEKGSPCIWKGLLLGGSQIRLPNPPIYHLLNHGLRWSSNQSSNSIMAIGRSSMECGNTTTGP